MLLHLLKLQSPSAEQAMSDHNSLEHAPNHVKLAVDLIMLLEQHDLDAKTVLKALDIVQKDYEQKAKESA